MAYWFKRRPPRGAGFPITPASWQGWTATWAILAIAVAGGLFAALALSAALGTGLAATVYLLILGAAVALWIGLAFLTSAPVPPGSAADEGATNAEDQ